MEQCRSRGIHGYSRKSKQELEELLAPVIEVQPEPTEPIDPQPTEPTPETMAPESTVTPNVTLPLRVFSQSWVSVCLGIPPYLLPYIKRPSLIR
jgi:hypothetical protein